jgi:hypothetical protein
VLASIDATDDWRACTWRAGHLKCVTGSARASVGYQITRIWNYEIVKVQSVDEGSKLKYLFSFESCQSCQVGFEITKLSKSSLRVKDQVEICVVRIYWIKASFCLKVDNVIGLDLSKLRRKLESFRFKETNKNLIIYFSQPICDFETIS